MSVDAVFKIQNAYDFENDTDTIKSFAVQDGVFARVSSDPNGCDDLIGAGTTVVSDPQMTVVPTYFDTHNHMLWTSADIQNVDLEDARSISDIQNALRTRAVETPPGEWIVSSRRWHETAITEQRLPTAAELDEASTVHPILVRRGGHVASANTLALRLAGIHAETPDPPGGTIVRDDAGAPTGPLIEFPAYLPVLNLIPHKDVQERVDNLVETCRLYNSMGIGAVRDPGLDEAAMDVYLRAREEGRLTVRTNAMYRLDPAEDTAYKLRQLENFKLHPGHGDDWLAVDSLKIFSDGGVEGGWLSAGYANDEHYHGHGLVDKDDFYSLVREAKLRGWKVGTHAVGDLAVEMVVDTYEQVIKDLDAGDEHGLVIEHAFFANEKVRSRVISLGIPVTVQHPLLYALGGNMLTYWGEERTREVMPIRAWLEEGGQLSSGSDCNVAPVSPLLSIWGLVTRGTLNAGVQGEEYAIDRRTAFRLYTIEGARLVGAEGRRGRIKEGYCADFVCYQDDPLHCDLDDLPGLTPSMTWVGGRSVYEAPSRIPVSSN